MGFNRVNRNRAELTEIEPKSDKTGRTAAGLVLIWSKPGQCWMDTGQNRSAETGPNLDKGRSQPYYFLFSHGHHRLPLNSGAAATNRKKGHALPMGAAYPEFVDPGPGRRRLHMGRHYGRFDPSTPVS